MRLCQDCPHGYTVWQEQQLGDRFALVRFHRFALCARCKQTASECRNELLFGQIT